MKKKASFTVSLTDFAQQARTSGFMRGIAVGFASAFYVFDKGLTDGNITAAILRLATGRPAEVIGSAIVVIGTGLLAPTARRLLVAERDRRAKHRHLRGRLGLPA